MTTLDHVDRNALIGYAQKRLQEVVLKPLTLEVADSNSLDRAEALLAPLREHFGKLHLTIGELRLEGEGFAVDITQVPR